MLLFFKLSLLIIGSFACHDLVGENVCLWDNDTLFLHFFFKKAKQQCFSRGCIHVVLIFLDKYCTEQYVVFSWGELQVYSFY